MYLVGNFRSVAHQPAGIGKNSRVIDGGHGVARRQRHDLYATIAEEGGTIDSSALARVRTRLANAVSISRLVAVRNTSICPPIAAADRASAISESFGVAGLTSMANRAAPGATSCNSPSRLAVTLDSRF